MGIFKKEKDKRYKNRGGSVNHLQTHAGEGHRRLNIHHGCQAEAFRSCGIRFRLSPRLTVMFVELCIKTRAINTS